MPRKKRPSSSFSYRDLQALQLGTKQELRIPFGTSAEAVVARRDIHALRAAWQEERREGWQELYRASLHIDGSTLVIKPRSLTRKAEYDAAGVPDVLADEPAPPSAPDTNVATSSDPAENFLADLKKLGPSWED
jgi:hypothetical protein